MSEDLYEDLGVPEDASNDQIKKAYRAKAHKHHPDKGGDPEKFHEIQCAYETLIDPESRAKYDETGLAKQDESSLLDKATNTLIQLFRDIIQSAPLDQVDVIETAEKVLHESISNRESKLQDMRRKQRKIEKKLGKVKGKKNKKNLFELVIQEELNFLFENITEIDKELMVLNQVETMLQEYSDSDSDIQDVQRPTMATFRFGGGTITS